MCSDPLQPDDPSTNPAPSPPPADWISYDPFARLFRARMIDPPAKPGLPATLDRYEILELIGEGGMGMVLLARDPQDGAKVAIKLLRPEFAAEPHIVHRFQVEARHLRRLAHPHILPVREVSERPDGPYFVTPYLDGGALSRRLQHGVPMAEGEVRRIALQIADALAFAHDQGILHRDLKPGNVLLDGDDTAYLADFGLHRNLARNESMVVDWKLTCEGTAPYLAPEVAAGKAGDFRADIYSFGAMLYEMLTGHAPYEGQTAADIVVQIRSRGPTPLRERNPRVSAGLAHVVEGCLARALRDRYAHMADVAADLKALDAGGGPVGARGRLRWVSRVSKRGAALAGVLALLTIAVGIAWSRSIPVPVVRLTENDLGKSGPPAARIRLPFEDNFASLRLDRSAWEVLDYPQPTPAPPDQEHTVRSGLEAGVTSNGLRLGVWAESDQGEGEGWSISRYGWLNSRINLKAQAPLEATVQFASEGSVEALIFDGRRPHFDEERGYYRLPRAQHVFRSHDGGTNDRDWLNSVEDAVLRLEVWPENGMALVFSGGTLEQLCDLRTLNEWRLSFYVYACASRGSARFNSRIVLLRFEVKPIQGDQTGLAGIVTDALTDWPLEGAVVQTWDGGHETASSAQGAYLLHIGPTSGPFQSTVMLRVSCSGFGDVTDATAVSEPGVRTRRDLELHRATPQFGAALEPALNLPGDIVIPWTFTLTGSALYVGHKLPGQPQVVRLSMDAQVTERRWNLPGVSSLAAFGDTVFAGRLMPGELYRISGTEPPAPEGAVWDRYAPHALAFDGDDLWMLEWDFLIVNRRGLSKINFRTGELIGFIDAASFPESIAGMAFGAGRLYLCTKRGRLLEVDPDRALQLGKLEGEAIVREARGVYYDALSYGRGALWGLDRERRRIYRIYTGEGAQPDASQSSSPTEP